MVKKKVEGRKSKVASRVRVKTKPVHHEARTESRPEDAVLSQVLTALEEMKALDIRIFNVQKLAGFTDYFVFCTGNSHVQIEAIADEVRKNVKSGGIIPRQNGESKSGWLVVDCGMVVVHCFGQAERAYYNLEQLWKEADVVYHHY